MLVLIKWFLSLVAFLTAALLIVGVVLVILGVAFGFIFHIAERTVASLN